MTPPKKQIFGKIPAKICTHDRETARLYAFFICLKQIKYNGLLYDFKKNRKQYATTLEVHINTIKNYERALILRGWAYWNGKHLQLRAYKHIWNLNGWDCYRFIKITDTTYNEVKNQIDTVPIYENLRKQVHIARCKISALEFNNFKATDQYNMPTDELYALVKKANQRAQSDASYLRLIKSLWKNNAPQIWRRYENAYYTGLSSGIDEPPIVPYTVVSMAGFAYLVAGKQDAHNSGYSIRKRLERAGLIKCECNKIRVTPNVTAAAKRFQPFGVFGKERQLITRVNIGN
jgi:hypothetical protein